MMKDMKKTRRSQLWALRCTLEGLRIALEKTWHGAPLDEVGFGLFVTTNDGCARTFEHAGQAVGLSGAVASLMRQEGAVRTFVHRRR